MRNFSLLGAVCAGLVLGFSVLGVINIAFAIIALAVIAGLSERSKNASSAFFIGLLFGLAFFLISYWPVSTAGGWTGWSFVTHDGTADASSNDSGSSIEYVLWVLLLLFSFLSSLTTAAVCAITNYINRKTSKAFFYLAFFLTWLLLVEEFRSQIILGGYYLINLGLPLVNFIEFAQLASFGGVTALSGLLLVLSFIVLDFFSRRRITGCNATFLLIVILSFAYGKYRIEVLADDALLQIPAMAVQESIAKTTELDPVREDYNEHWMSRRYLAALENAIINIKPGPVKNIIVLPESIGFGAMSIDGSISKQSPERTLSDIAGWDASISRFFSEQQLVVVVGSDTTEKGRDYNSLIVWDSHGQVSRYHKRELVPFAEYTPTFLKKHPVFASRVGYSSGQGYQVRGFGGFHLSFFICQETLFPHLVTDTVAQGKANLIIVSGNDGVFQSQLMNKLNHNQARLRAIEVGRDMVRSMKSGISSVISADGRVIDEVLLKEVGVAEGLLKSRLEDTIYSKAPFLFIKGLIGLFLLMVFSMIRVILKQSNSNEYN